MRLDITKLPVLEGVILFLLIALAGAFTGAFIAVSDDGESSADDDGVATETPVDTGNGTPGGDEIAVSMGDNFFDPDGITVGAGASVTFQLTNNGIAIHNMHVTVDGEFDSDICDGTGDPCSDPAFVSGGQEAVLTWTAPDSAGEVPFRCDFHPIEMVGTITVQ